MDSEYFHFGEDALTAGTDPDLRVCGTERHSDCGQFFPSVGDSRGADNRAGSGFLRGLLPTVTGKRLYGLLLALASRAGGSLFFGGCLDNIGFTAAEVTNPKRDVALSMAFGTIS